MGILGSGLLFCQPLRGQELFNYGTTVGPFVTGTQRLAQATSPRVRLGVGFATLFYPGSSSRPSFRLNFVPLQAEIVVAANANLLLSWDVRQRIEAGGANVIGPGDLVISSVFGFLKEGRQHPGLGILIETKLPNASDKGSWLGTDNTDFFTAVILSKGDWAANVGLAILGSPVDPPLDSSNDDFLLFGLEWQRKVAARWQVEAEVAGFVSERGRDDYAVAAARGWVRWRHFELGVEVRVGLTRVSERFGAMTLWRLPIPMGSRN